MNPVYFVGAGAGDPDLITLKGRRLLDEAEVIVYAGSLVNSELLAGLDAELHDSAPLDLDRIMEIMITAWEQGRRVVRLHTGDPAIYGAIREQILRLRARDIPYRIVPGVTAALASAAALGVELTVPGITQTVIFTRQAGRTPVPSRERLRSLAAIRATLCIFLSVSMIETVVRELLAGGYGPGTPAAVVEKASWPEERIVRSTLAAIADQVRAAGITKTAMILVGEALDPEQGEDSRLYDPRFSHGCREGED